MKHVLFDLKQCLITPPLDDEEYIKNTLIEAAKIAKCNETLIPHLTLNPDYTFGVSIAVITILLAGYGLYRGFFANKGLADPWDDHDD